MSPSPRVTKPATKVDHTNLLSMAHSRVSLAEDPLKGLVEEDLKQATPPKFTLIKPKKPLSATVESDHEGIATPDSKSSGPSLKTGGTPTPKQLLKQEVTYRDIPNDQIDMNPKSSKKLKRKKSKKGKSSRVSLAKASSPTPAEKQARLVENLKLYNPSFVVGSNNPTGNNGKTSISTRAAKPFYAMTMSEKQNAVLARIEQYQKVNPAAGNITVTDMFVTPASQATLFKLVKQHAKDFPLNTFSGELIKELEKPVVSPKKLIGIMMEATAQMPRTKEEMAVVMENLRLYALMYPGNQYTVQMIKVLEDSPGLYQDYDKSKASEKNVGDKIPGYLACRGRSLANMKVLAAQGMKPYDQLTTSEQSDALLETLQTYHTQFPGNTITAPLIMALLNKPGSITIDDFFNRILEVLHTPASDQDGNALVANLKLYQQLTPENQDFAEFIVLCENKLLESVKEGGKPVISFLGRQFHVESEDGAQHTFDSVIVVDQFRLLKNTKKYAKEFPQNTFSVKLVNELQQIAPNPFAINRLMNEATSRVPTTPKEAIVVFEDLRLCEKLFPTDSCAARMLKVLEANPDIYEGTVTGRAKSAAACEAAFVADFGHKATARTEEPKFDSKTVALIEQYDRIFPENIMIASFERELDSNTPICADIIAKIIDNAVDRQLPGSNEELAIALANLYVSGRFDPKSEHISGMMNLTSGRPRSRNWIVDTDCAVMNPIKNFMQGSSGVRLDVKGVEDGARVRDKEATSGQITAKKLKQLDRNFPKNTIIAKLMHEFEKQAFIPGDVMIKMVDECISNTRGEELAVALANLYVFQQFDPQGQDPKSAAISDQIKVLEGILAESDRVESDNDTAVVFGPGVSEEEAEAQMIQRARAKIHESLEKRFAALKKTVGVPSSSAEKPVDGTTRAVKPPMTSLHAESGVKFDLKGSTKDRADAFWSSPEKILDTKSADLNASFRQGMERAAGAKINGMSISSPTKGADTYNAGTTWGGEGCNELEDNGFAVMERPRLETKESDSIVKLEERLADLAIDGKDFESKLVDTANATASNAENTSLANELNELSIITVEDPCGNTLVEFGTTIPEVLEHLEAIFANDSRTNPFTTDIEKGQNLTDFFNCSMALWRLIHFALKSEDYEKKTGLGVLSKLAWFAFKNPDLPRGVRTAMLRKLDMWFIEEWQKAKGDLDVVKEHAKKVVVANKQGLMDLFSAQDVRGALTTAISKASSNTTEDVEEKINLTFIWEESPMEQKVEEMSREVEKEDADVSHESMEYIEPSSLTIDTDDIIRVDLANKTEGLKNSSIDANLHSPTSPPNSPESITTSEFVPHPTNHSQPSSSTYRNISENNMHPPTPPMTYDEMSSLPQATADLESIHTSLSTLKSTLETINHSIYGTASDSPLGTELVTEAKDAGLLLITSYLGEWLKEAKLQISKLDIKLTSLDSKLGDIHSQNASLGSKLGDIQQRVVLGNVKGAENEELIRRVNRNVAELKMLILGELKDIKGENEGLIVRQGEMEKVFGEKVGEVDMWCEKVRELEEVIEEGEQEDALTEVLWPQGDEVARCKETVEGDSREKFVAPKELYSCVGNEAGRGQGGGGFCGVM